jgi:hypothetical protein
MRAEGWQGAKRRHECRRGKHECLRYGWLKHG